MISLNKCSERFSAADDLFIKTGVVSETKDVNVSASNMITRIHIAKTLIKHTSCDNSTTCSSNQKQYQTWIIIIIPLWPWYTSLASGRVYMVVAPLILGAGGT